MTLDEIAEVMRFFRASGLAEFEHQAGGARLMLRRASASSPAPAPSAPEPVTARAPDFGLFRAAHPQRGALEVALGDSVREGQVLGYVETEELLRAVTAPKPGRVVELLAQEGDLVGFAQPLFRLS